MFTAICCLLLACSSIQSIILMKFCVFFNSVLAQCPNLLCHPLSWYPLSCSYGFQSKYLQFKRANFLIVTVAVSIFLITRFCVIGSFNFSSFYYAFIELHIGFVNLRLYPVSGLQLLWRTTKECTAVSENSRCGLLTETFEKQECGRSVVN